MKKPLNVFFEKKLVGTLSKKEDDTLSFHYSAAWLNDGAKTSPPIRPSFNKCLQEAGARIFL
jgi:HipA-like protein